MRYNRNNTLTFLIVLMAIGLCLPVLGQSSQKPLVTTVTYDEKDIEVYYYVQYKTRPDTTGTLLFQNGQNKDDIQNIDFDGAKEGRIEIEIIEVKGFKGFQKPKLFIKRDCALRSTELRHLSDDTPIVKRGNGKIRKKIIYKAIRNGKSQIIIDLGTTKRKDINEAKCNDGEIVINYNITGVYEKPKPAPTPVPDPTANETMVNPEIVDWKNVNKSDIASLGNFLLKYPNGIHKSDATKALRIVDDKLWERTEALGKLSNYVTYKNTFTPYKQYARHYRKAIEKINEIKNAKALKKEWNDFIAKDPDEKAIATFIESSKYNTNKSKAFKLLLENHPNLEYRQQENGNNIRIEITNPYFKPRYKNSSLNDGLAINHAAWSDDYILDVEVKKNEEFKIVIQDSLNRTVVIPFGNTFDVKMTVSDTAYVFNILGGKTPYTIELFNSETEHQESFNTDDSKYTLSKKDLLAQGLLGDYAVKVKYKNGPEPKEITRSIFLKEESSNKVLIFLIIALLLMAGSALYYFFFMKQKKTQQSIFNH